jgi:predicted tellurium resistance membrane protein TerC
MSVFKVTGALLAVVFSIVFTFTIIELTELQKINNYKRCISVVSMAIKTGKIKNKDAHEECKFYLEK